MPDDSKILSKLVSLNDERFQELIDDGTTAQVRPPAYFSTRNGRDITCCLAFSETAEQRGNFTLLFGCKLLGCLVIAVALGNVLPGMAIPTAAGYDEFVVIAAGS